MNVRFYILPQIEEPFLPFHDECVQLLSFLSLKLDPFICVVNYSLLYLIFIPLIPHASVMVLNFCTNRLNILLIFVDMKFLSPSIDFYFSLLKW